MIVFENCLMNRFSMLIFTRVRTYLIQFLIGLFRLQGQPAAGI